MAVRPRNLMSSLRDLRGVWDTDTPGSRLGLPHVATAWLFFTGWKPMPLFTGWKPMPLALRTAARYCLAADCSDSIQRCSALSRLNTKAGRLRLSEKTQVLRCVGSVFINRRFSIHSDPSPGGGDHSK